MLDFLTQALYRISNALLVPVIISILGLLVWTILMLGGFIREWVERRKLRPALDEAVSSARRKKGSLEIMSALQRVTSGLPKRFAEIVRSMPDDRLVLEQGLTSIQNLVAASVARHSFITRISPILGLMGTLIPLGPALSGLANGNMQALSGNLIVAFTATVVGLLISGVAYGMGLTRRIWYATDLSNLEFIVDTLHSDKGGPIA